MCGDLSACPVVYRCSLNELPWLPLHLRQHPAEIAQRHSLWCRGSVLSHHKATDSKPRLTYPLASTGWESNSRPPTPATAAIVQPEDLAVGASVGLSAVSAVIAVRT